MEFSLIIDEEYYRFLNPNPHSCGFASPFGGVYLNLPKLHRTIAGLIREQRPGIEQKLRFGGLDDAQKKKLADLIIHPFTDDIYLTKVVISLNHEVFHNLLYDQDEFYGEIYQKKDLEKVHHKLIEELEKGDFYTFGSGRISEPVDLTMYVEGLVK